MNDELFAELIRCLAWLDMQLDSAANPPRFNYYTMAEIDQGLRNQGFTLGSTTILVLENPGFF